MVLPPIAVGGNYGPSNSVPQLFFLGFMYMVFGRDSKYPHIKLCPEHVSLVFLHRGGVWFIFRVSRFSAPSSSLSRAFFPCLLAHNFRPYQALIIYLTTLANSTLNILFSKMLKFVEIISSKSKNIVKENSEYLGIFYLLK